MVGRFFFVKKRKKEMIRAVRPLGRIIDCRPAVNSGHTVWRNVFVEVGVSCQLCFVSCVCLRSCVCLC